MIISVICKVLSGLALVLPLSFGSKAFLFLSFTLSLHLSHYIDNASCLFYQTRFFITARTEPCSSLYLYCIHVYLINIYWINEKFLIYMHTHTQNFPRSLLCLSIFRIFRNNLSVYNLVSSLSIHWVLIISAILNLLIGFCSHFLSVPYCLLIKNNMYKSSLPEGIL